MKQEQVWVGMHNGTIRGKGFEKSRRSRVSHMERRSRIVGRSLEILHGKKK